MRYAKNLQNNWKLIGFGSILISLAVLAALTLSVALTSGCTSTVTPRTVLSSQASWDGTNQNSGFIGFEGSAGIITPHARDRYNALIEIYGKKFNPPITFDYGVWPMGETGGNYIISPQALTYFTQMNRWRKSATP